MTDKESGKGQIERKLFLTMRKTNQTLKSSSRSIAIYF